jgi:hypothetical protein
MASSAAELLKGRARTAASAEAYGQACGVRTNGEQMQSRAVAPPEKLD